MIEIQIDVFIKHSELDFLKFVEKIGINVGKENTLQNRL